MLLFSQFFAIFMVGLILGAMLCQHHHYRRELSYVRLRDLWEYVGPDEKNRGIYEVKRENDGTEAGPDSWVMERIIGRNEKGKVLYMHHNARARGEWMLRFRDGSPMGGRRS